MPSVLIVDDAAFMRLTLKTMLERHGFEIVGSAENGSMGVQKYKECVPDIVTMDITMPEMTGIEALQAITSYDAKARVIMVSAMGQEYLITEAIQYGAKNFIVKPFTEDRVVQTLKQVMAL